MKVKSPVNMSRFIEMLTLIFMWLVVVGSGLLGIGLAIMYEMGHHG